MTSAGSDDTDAIDVDDDDDDNDDDDDDNDDDNNGYDDFRMDGSKERKKETYRVTSEQLRNKK